MLSVASAAIWAVDCACFRNFVPRSLLGPDLLEPRAPSVAKVKSERASARVISWFETSRKGSTSDHGPVSFGFSGLSGADPTDLAYSTGAGGSSAD